MDIVKVLKSQDSNYIRTVRASGLKVHQSNDLKLKSGINVECVQKIAALKAQLTALVDLVTPERAINDDSEEENDELDEEEAKTLREAGILPEPSKGKQKGKAKAKSNHIIFVDDAWQGMSYYLSIFLTRC